MKLVVAFATAGSGPRGHGIRCRVAAAALALAACAGSGNPTAHSPAPDPRTSAAPLRPTARPLDSAVAPGPSAPVADGPAPGGRHANRAGQAVLIRLRNASDTLELRAVYAIFPDDTVLFGDLPPKAASAWHAVERSYRYAYVRAQAGGREWALQPADYTGESLLPPGRYTWSIKPHEGPYPGFLDFDAAREAEGP